MAGVFSYEQSLFARIQKKCPESVLLLNTQYRMHPDISQFPNSYFYKGCLLNGPDMARINYRSWHEHPLLGPFRFFDISGREETRIKSSGLESRSKMNEMEAQVAANIVALVCKHSNQSVPMLTSGSLVTNSRWLAK